MNQDRITAFLVAMFITPMGCFAGSPDDSPPGPTPPTDLAASVGRALPYLQREGVGWMEKRGCVSCHQIPFMVWSLSAAQQSGFDVDADKLKQWRKWSTDVVNFVKPEQKEDVDRTKTMASNIDTMSAMLLAVDDAPETPWRETFATALADNQKKNGSWKSCGQLPAQKRPAKETTAVTAAWTMLALSSARQQSFDAAGALAIIDGVENAESTEWWAARLLLSARIADGKQPQLRTALLSRQNADGGWGWIIGEQSDALATGMALYALRLTSTSNQADAALEKATALLLSTQQDDGSWKVPGTKKSTKNKPTPTASYWGTAWAVIGLLADPSSTAIDPADTQASANGSSEP